MSRTNFDCNSQMKKKFKLSEVTKFSDTFSRTETDLKRLDKCDHHFKYVLETTISENVLLFQDRKFSENTSIALISPFYLGAGTRNTSKNLRSRQHMDKLS